MSKLELNASETVLVVVDAQTKLIPVMYDAESVLKQIQLLAFMCRELRIPRIFTEQYPKGLGNTLEIIQETEGESFKAYPKTSFSCFGEVEFASALTQLSPKHLIICGVESHVCVLQTVLDALNKGYQVSVVVDAISSRNTEHMHYAIATMRNAGAHLLPLETLIFGFLKDAKHPLFKTFSQAIK